MHDNTVAGRDGLSWGHALRPFKRKKRGAKFYEHMALTYYMVAIKKDPCCYCGKAGGTIDHIVPRSRLKGSTWENKSGACKKCNSSKSNQGLLLYLVRRGRGRRAAVKLRTGERDAKITRSRTDTKADGAVGQGCGDLCRGHHPVRPTDTAGPRCGEPHTQRAQTRLTERIVHATTQLYRRLSQLHVMNKMCCVTKWRDDPRGDGPHGGVL